MNTKKQYQKEQRKRRWVYTFYGSKWFSFPLTFKWRIKAYQKAFNIGKNPIIENNVFLSRTHGLNGKIQIGDNVLFAKNCFVDYTGDVIIEDNVWISEGAHIFSHDHLLTTERTQRGKDTVIYKKIILRKNCWIGANAIITSNVGEIGENSVVGAGSVVTKTVPANVLVAGNPARIIKNLFENE